MGKASKKPLHRQYISIRSHLSLVLLPAVALPGALWALARINDRLSASAEPLEWYWWAGLVGIFLIFPIWAFIKTRFARYHFYADRLVDERGLLARTSGELRVKDIQNIQIQQTFLQRILWIGDITFTTPSGQSLMFAGVSRPKRVRELVDELREGRTPEWLQKKLVASEPSGKSSADASQTERETGSTAREDSPTSRPDAKSGGADERRSSTSAEQARANATAGGARSSSADEDNQTRDELWRLLAEQESEENETERGS